MHILQIIIPFLIAGIGTCFAGIILDHVQFWEVFTSVNELYFLLPALLGLKGNLQMTLASRVSTHFHLGHVKTKEDLLSLAFANISLNQCLSIIIGLNASFLALIIHLCSSENPSDATNLIIITSTALLTSSVTSFLLDILLILVIQAAAIYDINPDNIATPIAAALGDMTALISCAYVGDSFFASKNSPLFQWLGLTVILVYLILIPIWASIARDNLHTTNILLESSHWYPLITAMVISSVSGVILQIAISKSDDIALFQPVICGVGGNLVAVQASRLSTLLHRNQEVGFLPDGESICMNPLNMFSSERPGYSITRILLIIVMPGQCFFYFFCLAVNSILAVNYQPAEPSIPFLILYLLGSQLLVFILIYLAYVLTYALWVLKVDPDNTIIPYLTSIGDIIGSSIVTAICFITMPITPKKQ